MSHIKEFSAVPYVKYWHMVIVQSMKSLFLVIVAVQILHAKEYVRVLG